MSDQNGLLPIQYKRETASFTAKKAVETTHSTTKLDQMTKASNDLVLARKDSQKVNDKVKSR